ncbi:MAG: hypothetical protein ACI8XC_001278 [Gammaproteobacteria bacterium]|jgi:uncharacterized protein with NRDE domain
MCLILFAFKQHPDYPLLVIANRDEFYERPTQSAAWWQDHPDILAGRDLQAGGTWLGVNQRGHFAAVTNVREPGAMSPGKKSRGELPTGFLSADVEPQAYLETIQKQSGLYSGFNLLVGDQNQLWFLSNRQESIRVLEPGIYGICNGQFNEPWPKLKTGREALRSVLKRPFTDQNLMSILTDSSTAPPDQLPETGVSSEIEHLLSSRFICSDNYGTRASTLVSFHATNTVEFIEQNYNSAGHQGDAIKTKFTISKKTLP